jgi:hypothetical protein
VIGPHRTYGYTVLIIGDDRPDSRRSDRLDHLVDIWFWQGPVLITQA